MVRKETSSFTPLNPAIKVATIPLTTSAMPFQNTPASPTTTWVTEIIRIQAVSNNAGSAALVINRGQSAYINLNDPSVIFYSSVSAQSTVQQDYHDGAGNGLLVPEETLFVTINSSYNYAKIYYKMREVENEDLFMFYANYNKA